jgi:lipid II:glycine glycyltransferase (peptidoglycan interpeptide bridge formation enzyme)
MLNSTRNPLPQFFLFTLGNGLHIFMGLHLPLNRKYMATYALQWEALRRAKKKGCSRYDMFGVAPQPDPAHPLFGLYRFKVGFGGDLFHRMGCWDYPLNPKNYEIYLAAEMNSLGYHLH